jgi:hypothetical protein
MAAPPPATTIALSEGGALSTALRPQQERAAMATQQSVVNPSSKRSVHGRRRWLVLAGALIAAAGLLVGGGGRAHASDVGIRQTTTMGGYAEFLRDFPVAAGAASAARVAGGARTAPAVPMGGFAELLRDQQHPVATTGVVSPNEPLPARPMGRQAEALLFRSLKAQP